MAIASQRVREIPEHESLDDTVHEACYVFSPRTDESDRPLKRRKLSKGVSSTRDERSLFPVLLNGQEEEPVRDLRYKAYTALWESVEKQTRPIAKGLDDRTVQEVRHFTEQQALARKAGKISTALIATGPETAVYSRLIEGLRNPEALSQNALIIEVDSSQNSNLKNALRSLIKSAIVQWEGLDKYANFLISHKKTIPLNYDLELLQDYILEKDIEKIIISIEDGDTCQTEGLAELVSVLSSWTDRLPLILFLGVAASIDLFETRLPRSMIRQIEGTCFDLQPNEDIYWQIFKASQSIPHITAWLGREACDILSERSRDQSSNPESFVQAIKYAYMSHFFASPLIVLSIDAGGSPISKPGALCEAIRNTDSFSSHVEEMLDAEDVSTARKLLNDDTYLLSAAKEALSIGRSTMPNVLAAVDTISVVLSTISKSPPSPFELYSLALSRDLTTSSPYREMFLSLKALSPEKVQTLLSHPTLISTLPNMTPKSLPTDLNAHLTSLLSPVPPTNLFLQEAFLTSNAQRAPLSTAIWPRPRHAIIRALSSPADYLACECCADITEDAVRATLPATGMLWRLWCEAGAVVNVRDLWDAFRNVVVEDRDGEEEGEGEGKNGDQEGIVNERMALALFYRGLAELRMLGFVKGSGRRRGEWLEKRGWKGL